MVGCRNVILFALLGLLVGCSSTRYGGATSETTNGVASLVINEQGNPVVGAEVYLRSRTALSHPDSMPDLPVTYTDSEGQFLIEDVPAGEYFLEVRDTSSGKKAVQDGVLVSAQGKVQQKDTLVVAKPGALVGVLSDTSLTTLGKAYVQVYGLGRAVWVDPATGHFSVTDLPAGPVHIRVVVDTDVISVKDSFMISSNSTTDAGVYQVGLQKELQIVANFLEVNNLPTDVSFLMSIVEIEDNHIRSIELDSALLDSLVGPSARIDTLTPEVCMLRLYSLSLAGNRLTTLPQEIGNLVELFYLDVSYNNLTVLPDGVGLLAQCTEIDIESNDIADLPVTVYQLTNLDEIHVANNRFTLLSGKMKTWMDQHASQQDWEALQRP